MTRFSVRALLGRLGASRLKGYVQTGTTRAMPFPPRRRDEDEDGPGVPVPVGPRPRRGGAQAQPPREEEETLVMPPLRG
ncbi:hypothetical protein F8S09_14415 [Deinococcus sp. SDU3-2]|uniref:Uncharacterized protein n=1 Tax=Deinococcus terrestris TaxID=2651870 RepID=A0A7X1NXZ0_9DEIO|nr:hypothetical protein [Deinococcus terrestris]MPY67860.1 hypothetical protein [Deinococcus terrestris]